MSSLLSGSKHDPQPNCPHAWFHMGQWLDPEIETGMATEVLVTICKPSEPEKEGCQASAELLNALEYSYDKEAKKFGLAGLADVGNAEYKDKMKMFRTAIFESAVQAAYSHLNLEAWNFDDVAEHPNATAWYNHRTALEVKSATCEVPIGGSFCKPKQTALILGSLFAKKPKI